VHLVSENDDDDESQQQPPRKQATHPKPPNPPPLYADSITDIHSRRLSLVESKSKSGSPSNLSVTPRSNARGAQTLTTDQPTSLVHRAGKLLK